MFKTVVEDGYIQNIDFVGMAENSQAAFTLKKGDVEPARNFVLQARSILKTR